MTQAPTRPRAFRAALLLLAALHVLSAATLPLTHRHALRGGPDVVRTAEDSAGTAGADLHPCTVCRTLAATFAPDAAELPSTASASARAGDPAATEAPRGLDARTVVRSRAPPLV
jgi:hypothetical protein